MGRIKLKNPYLSMSGNEISSNTRFEDLLVYDKMLLDRVGKFQRLKEIATQKENFEAALSAKNAIADLNRTAEGFKHLFALQMKSVRAG